MNESQQLLGRIKILRPYLVFFVVVCIWFIYGNFLISYVLSFFPISGQPGIDQVKDGILVIFVGVLLVNKNNFNKKEDSNLDFFKIFRNNPQPMWIFDIITLKFIEVNNSACSLYGYTRPEFFLMTTADIRPPEEIELFKQLISNRLSSFSLSQHEFSSEPKLWKHRKKNGDILLVRVHTYYTYFNGHKVGMATLINMTDEQEHITKIEKQNSTLKELAFISTHDIRRPVSSILGLVDLIDKKHPESSENMEILTYIEKSAEELDLMIHQIVEKCRVEI